MPWRPWHERHRPGLVPILASALLALIALMGSMSQESEGHTAVSSAWTQSEVTNRQLREGEMWLYAETAGWPPELIPELLRVAWCESNWTPYAENGHSYGLAQLVPLWFSYSGESFDHWDSPITNLRAARAAYLYDIARGNTPWAQWSCRWAA